MSNQFDKSHWQETLEGVGVPVNLAQASAEVLKKEEIDSSYQRTPEEQETVNHAYQWWVAKGQRTTSSTNQGN